MNPDTTGALISCVLHNWHTEALEDFTDDLAEAYHAAGDLLEWLGRGGFKPTGGVIAAVSFNAYRYVFHIEGNQEYPRTLRDALVCFRRAAFSHAIFCDRADSLQ